VSEIHTLDVLRDRCPVFRDRAEAGRVLAGMLEELRGSDLVMLAVPAGGVPVAAPIARALGLPLDVAVVSKITLPWTSEAGYGAVAFDGTVLLDEALVARLGLDEATTRHGIESTLEKVRSRQRSFRGGREAPDLSGRTVLVVDDGLASGITLRAAVAALRRAGAARIVIAVPTGSARAVALLAPLVDALYCANVRGGQSFAVADAYERWSDVSEAEAAAMLSHKKE
jgi:putative phosphoribosyl transferase